jgi:hypothetical protein
MIVKSPLTPLFQRGVRQKGSCNFLHPLCPEAHDVGKDELDRGDGYPTEVLVL